jgi:hypothetical protein
MAPDQDDTLEALLGDETDEKPKDSPAGSPAPPEAKRAEAPAAAKDVTPSAGTEKAEAAPAAAAAPAPKGSPWIIVTVVILVLLAAAAGLGWYANQLRMELAQAKDELQTLKTQASGMEATAGNVADDLLPTIEEHATVAKLRAAAGDAEGAEYSLTVAKRYADMAEKLSGGTPSGKLRELTALIEATAGTGTETATAGTGDRNPADAGAGTGTATTEATAEPETAAAEPGVKSGAPAETAAPAGTAAAAQPPAEGAAAPGKQ